MLIAVAAVACVALVYFVSVFRDQQMIDAQKRRAKKELERYGLIKRHIHILADMPDGSAEEKEVWLALLKHNLNDEELRRVSFDLVNRPSIKAAANAELARMAANGAIN